MQMKLYERAVWGVQRYSFNYIPKLIFLECTRKIGQTDGFSLLWSLDLSPNILLVLTVQSLI